MKRFTPFIFPAIVFLIVAFLVWRWYDLRAERAAQRLDFGEGVEIENLSDAEQEAVRTGAGDFETVALERTESADGQAPLAGMENAAGVFRYEVQDDRVVFSVMAELPESSDGMYQVWLKEVDGETTRKAFSLEMGKGGYEGSAAVASELLPFEVLVTKEMTDDETAEAVILRGVVNAPESTETNEVENMDSGVQNTPKMEILE